VALLGKKVFGLGEQSAFQSLGTSSAGPFDCQCPNVLQIAVGSAPGVHTGTAGLRRDAAQGDEDFAFQPILRRSKDAFAKLAPAEVFAVGWPASW
jgi:hypothetical protein